MVTTETIHALAACRERLRPFIADPELRRSLRAAAAAYQETLKNQQSIKAALRAAQERHRSMTAAVRTTAAAWQEQLRAINATAGEWHRFRQMSSRRDRHRG